MEASLVNLDRSEASTRRSLSLLRATLDATADGILVVDMQGRIVHFNTRFSEMWGIPPEIMARREDARAVEFALDQVADPDAFVARIDELYARPDAESYDVIEFRDGRIFERHSLPQEIGGEIVGRVWSYRDATARLRAEREAHQTADRMRAIATAAAGVVGAESLEALEAVLREACRRVVPFDSFILLIYHAETHTFSYFANEDMGVCDPPGVVAAAGTPAERVLRERRSLVTLRADDPQAHGAKLVGTGRRSESIIRTPILSGDEVLGILSVQSYTPELYTGQDVEVLETVALLAAPAMTNIRLLDERRAAEAALRDSERRFRTIFEQFPLSLQIFAPTGESLEVNQAWRDLFRTTPEALADYNLLEDPQLAEIAAHLRRGFAGETVMLPPGRYDARHAMAQLTGVENEELPGPTWLQAFVCPVKDAAGRVREVFIIHQDVTRQKEAEAVLRRSHEELEQLVAERTTELAATNARLEAEIAERQRAEEEMRRAKNEAERANHAKSEFLSRMSHELRTPMNSILGFAQLLANREPSAEQRKKIEHILRAGQHLLKLIDEVLDIARIEANRQQLSLEPVQVRALAQEALSLIRPLAAQRECELASELAGDCQGYVRADRQRLSQVLLNLLSNAVKYNRPGGRVSLSCETLPASDDGASRLCIRVSDTGPGIPEEKRDQLFVPFSRLGAEQSEIEGTGLGLALSKRLVEAMGGRLGVESEVEVGSTFWVELPLTENPLQRRASTRANAGDTPAASRPTRAATLLYIEDNLANLSLIESILTERPAIELLSALQGQLGLDLAWEHDPDLVLLDLHLPDMEGAEVLRRLRSDPRTRETPVVVISADATPGCIERLRAAGARAYLTKPLEVKLFLETVDGILSDGGG